ncbi:uncharacterized protein UMAG_06077 [Mycosarcoma maydis]|uniref:Uncharacterized protein n=1 Tax=Mycosarcoma maydis TaxID=5270 RepID=A0A0D1BV92_MYCMD|nr:uncharacterized protein UMAG_06077 [Ustilago maydis 521]KIS65987.1 hypothetical protein UMAG_06077 [Ustilago maydis 521]|eukprot:XP_011392437.1 hypothetical protein UMAG_06077 [Ustilago maydis 521]
MTEAIVKDSGNRDSVKAYILVAGGGSRLATTGKVQGTFKSSWTPFGSALIAFSASLLMLRIGPWCQLMEHVQIPAEPVETPTFPPWERQSVPVQLQKSTRARKTAVAPETPKMFRIKIQRQSPLSQSERSSNSPAPRPISEFESETQRHMTRRISVRRCEFQEAMLAADGPRQRALLSHHKEEQLQSLLVL